MGCRLLPALLFLSLLAGNQRRFVDTAHLDLKNVAEYSNDETVKELESLKTLLGQPESSGNDGDEISVSETQTSFFSDLNGHKSGFKEIKNEVNKNGKVFAKVSQKVDLVKNKQEKPKSVSRTEVDIPSKGIHDVILKNNGNPNAILEKGGETDGAEFKRTGNGIDKMNSLSGIKYSPLDMAEYIFWTGDEKGVALTIEELLEEGLMSRQEAINFLQSIKFNLDFIQAHYQGLQKVDEKISSKIQDRKNMKRNLMNQEKYGEKSNGNIFEDHRDNTKMLVYDLMPKSGAFEDLSPAPKGKQNPFPDQLNDARSDGNEQEYSELANKNNHEMKSLNKMFDALSVSDDDYEEVLERLKVADFLYKEYSLEEVIFQLAKVMFSQSLMKENKEAQKALQRFSAFLQNEVKHGQISKNLERKILDVLITALMDTLSEHPELMASAKKELQNLVNLDLPTSIMLKELLMPGIEKSSPGKPNVKEGHPEKSLLSEEEKSSEGLLKKVE